MAQRSSRFDLDVVGEWGDPVLVGVLGRVAGAWLRVGSVGDSTGSDLPGLVGAVGWVLNLGSASVLAAGTKNEKKNIILLVVFYDFVSFNYACLSACLSVTFFFGR